MKNKWEFILFKLFMANIFLSFYEHYYMDIIVHKYLNKHKMDFHCRKIAGNMKNFEQGDRSTQIYFGSYFH